MSLYYDHDDAEVKPDSLDWATDQELIDQLLSRPNFAGLVIHEEQPGGGRWLAEVGAVPDYKLPHILGAILASLT